MKLKIYNTLTKEKEEFKPIHEGKAYMYSCGPTVYCYAHIGNLRAYLFMDNLRRVLKYNGYKLKHVMNITDVGHLVSDADEGEDKMMKAARIEHKDPYEIAKYYTDVFLKDMKKLNIDMPEIIAKATDHIKCMEDYVKKIIENGYTYQTENTIYFDTSKLKKYGYLSNKDVDEKDMKARIDQDPEKKHPNDFALWIKAPEDHIMKWDSFFGKCYPGWHLECSAMGNKYLGDQFDIHTGGIDHIPIHHENEIAQGIGYCGKIPAHYWMHVAFLKVDGGKMSKSLGNLYTLDDLQKRGYEPAVYRMFNFSSHYRTTINFTFEALDSAKTSLERLRAGYLKHLNGTQDVDDSVLSEYEQKFLDAINDDLNMSIAMSVVWDIIKNPIKSKKFADLILKFDEVMGFDLKHYDGKNEKESQEIPKEIQELVNLRNEARKNKNWSESDRLRAEIQSKGYSIKDGKNGTEIVAEK